MHHAFDEIAHRKATFDALEVIIRSKFIITPSKPQNRIRRNMVHAAILGGYANGGGDWYMRKLVGEKLLLMGAKKILSTGRRWFTNIEFKHE
jgi:hypothetical protein